VQIAYLADVRFPLERANGIQTFETCHALCARGHEVTLVVRPDTARPARDPFAFYGQRPLASLEVVRAPVPPGPLRRATYLAFAAQLVLRRRPDVVFTRDLGVAASLLRLPRRTRPPLVYESHGFAPEVSRALPRLLGHASPPSEAKLARLERRERRVWQKAEGYVTITAALAAELIDRYGGRDRLAVIADGVRLAEGRRFDAKPPGHPPVVAYAGHLYPWKGVDVLVEALAGLEHVRGLIVGGHPAERDVARVVHRIAALGVGDRVTMAGLVAPGAVAGHLATADVLALPNTATTISERYTSPLKLFEYMAAGRPIVVSDLPAIREVVRHGESAWLVRPGDATALAEGIGHVLAHADLARRLAERAWTDATGYSWARRAERLEELLAQARSDGALPMTPTERGR
jgi:glycosyltransferase involved in cell wall biosynthesis